jgi:BirA family biotin operon repressor/biotin-[acetyl-CoA-carboxylase] ligase
MISPLNDLGSLARVGRRVGDAIEAHDQIGSTNDRARELLAAGGADGMVVVAESQTAGRGRNGRRWISPAGLGLFLSAVLEPRLGVQRVGDLALGAGLAVAAACDPVAPVMLKWPNDVVAGDGRKLAGILIETILAGERVTGAVVGIGVNVEWPTAELPPELRETATSLAELAGAPVDRFALLDRLLDRLSEEVRSIEDGVSPLPRYRERCATLGQRVEVHVGERVMRGVARAIDDTGALVVESDGTRTALTGGEVRSVRLVPA